jgi:hypothetical protein
MCGRFGSPFDRLVSMSWEGFACWGKSSGRVPVNGVVFMKSSDHVERRSDPKSGNNLRPLGGFDVALIVAAFACIWMGPGMPQDLRIVLAAVILLLAIYAVAY